MKLSENIIRALCCKQKTDKEEDNNMALELIENAPEKDELDTHDGVIWFPKELMPLLKSDELKTPFIMKSKNLNLKLKFINKKFSEIQN